MKGKGELVLLTGTIKLLQKLKDYWGITAVEVRLKSYFNTLCFYITNSNFKYIVFCENSSYDFWIYNNLLIQLAKLNDKKYEFIQYVWNHELSEQLWFWYWEWECIDYAFDNSKLLTQVDKFWKITWRYIYTNIDNIVLWSECNENLLFKNFSQVVWIFTWLFKVKKCLYKKYLYDIKKEINLSICLEKLYYDKLVWEKINFWKINSIPIRMQSTIYDEEEVNKRNAGYIWKFLFFIWQRNFWYIYTMIDKIIIILMKIKHFLWNIIKIW